MKNPYLVQLKSELDTYATKCGNDRPESVLELLWYCYSSANTIDDGQIRLCEEALKPVYQELSNVRKDALFDLISDLVTAYQRAAFLEGMHTGAQLSTLLLDT